MDIANVGGGWSNAVGAVGSAVAAGFNYFGTKEQNRMNREIMHEQQAFQRESADTQMGFQERMSNTSYQRSVEDMKKAGLNPMLAVMKGSGASAPPGAMANSSAAPHMENPYASAANSAVQAMRSLSEVKNIRSQTNLNDALIKQSEATTTKTGSDTIRSWVDSVGDKAKDIIPWLLYFVSRGKVKPRTIHRGK